MNDTIYPTQANTFGCNPLKDDHIRQWREEGYCFVDGILNDIDINNARETMKPLLLKNIDPSGMIGVSSSITFPSTDPAALTINDITINERVIDSICQLLDCTASDIRLAQSEMWCKSGASKSQEQRIHVDAFNHYMTCPSKWDQPEAVEMIIYYDDTKVTGGGTAVVPRNGDNDAAYEDTCDADGNISSPLLLTPGGRIDLPWINDKDEAEAYFETNHPEIHHFRSKLYQRERYISSNVGSILFYRLDLWHRGTTIHKNAVRMVQNLCFRRASADWIGSWNSSIQREMYSQGRIVERMVSTATVKQKSVLGFPSLQGAYWSPRNLSLFKKRYAVEMLEPAR